MRYFLAFIVIVLLVSTSSTLNAQVRVGINFNLDRQPAWGPTGYDYVENYYLPDIDAYYNVPSQRYYYSDRGRWISSARLPSRFRNHNFFNSYKVVVNDKQPWKNHETVRTQYASYKGRTGQEVIRDSKDTKYFVNKNHPQHNNWLKQQKQNVGQDKKNDKNKK